MKLGDIVRFKKVLRKHKGKYTELECEGKGMVVGVRTVSEGHWDGEWDGYQTINKYWCITKSIPVVLIAINLKSFEKVRKEDLIFD